MPLIVPPSCVRADSGNAVRFRKPGVPVRQSGVPWHLHRTRLAKSWHFQPPVFTHASNIWEPRQIGVLTGFARTSS
jgi:hypothetical protein